MRPVLFSVFLLGAWLGLDPAEPARAAPLMNLDFEAADPGPGGDLLPGWTVGHEPWQDEEVVGPLYDSYCLGSRCVSVHDADTAFGTFTPIEGEYSVLIQGGTWPDGATYIEQTGDVPADARSITLLAWQQSVLGSLLDLSLSADGQELPLLGVDPDSYDVQMLRADVSHLAGQTIALRLSVDSRTLPPDYVETDVLVDALTFSPLPIPEPSMRALLALGLAAIAAARGRRPGR